LRTSNTKRSPFRSSSSLAAMVRCAVIGMMFSYYRRIVVMVLRWWKKMKGNAVNERLMRKGSSLSRSAAVSCSVWWSRYSSTRQAQYLRKCVRASFRPSSSRSNPVMTSGDRRQALTCEDVGRPSGEALLYKSQPAQQHLPREVRQKR
jgi:hypothetical protein